MAATGTFIEASDQDSEASVDSALEYDGPECLLCGCSSSSSDSLIELSGCYYCADCIAGFTNTEFAAWEEDELAAMEEEAVKDDLPASMPPLERTEEPMLEEEVIDLTEDEDEKQPAAERSEELEDEGPVCAKDEDEDEEEEVEEEGEVDAVRSAKWLPDWVLFRLDKERLRLVIEGVRQADGHSAATKEQLGRLAAGDNVKVEGSRRICTSGLRFRDQLIHACLHAGYSAYFTINSRAGEVRGYDAVPSDRHIYTEEEMTAALRLDSTRQFKPVRGKHDKWWVCYTEDSTTLPAQDVRYDGSPSLIREKKLYKGGWVAVHEEDGRVQQAESQSKLAALLSRDQSVICLAYKKGFRVGGVWRIFTAQQHEERGSGQADSQPVAAIPTQTADRYDEQRDGRVWSAHTKHTSTLHSAPLTGRCGHSFSLSHAVVLCPCQVCGSAAPRPPHLRPTRTSQRSRRRHQGRSHTDRGQLRLEVEWEAGVACEVEGGRCDRVGTEYVDFPSQAEEALSTVWGRVSEVRQTGSAVVAA